MSAQVTSSQLSPASALHTYMAKEDFMDCFSVASSLPARRAAEIITDFPGWAGALVSLRNLIVKPFGLQSDGPEAEDKIGLFPVVLETDEEVIAGFDDAHLNFRVSVRSENGRVSLATWVHRNNLGGRLYLALILPFHILIARNALKRVAATST